MIACRVCAKATVTDGRCTAQEDGAARVLDPVFAAVNNLTTTPLHGVFLKDYTVTDW